MLVYFSNIETEEGNIKSKLINTARGILQGNSRSTQCVSLNPLSTHPIPQNMTTRYQGGKHLQSQTYSMQTT